MGRKVTKISRMQTLNKRFRNIDVISECMDKK